MGLGVLENPSCLEQGVLKENVWKKFKGFLDRGEPPCDYERQLLLKHDERVEAILQGKIIPPYEVEIQPNSICNLDCKFCFGKVLTSGRLENKMQKQEIEIIAQRIDEFKENGFEIEVAKFCGTTGEPLVNPTILYGIELFKGLGKKVFVFTNGLGLDRETEDNGHYLDYVLEADKLNLSLDAGSEETFARLKGINGFGRVVNSLGRLIEKREQNGSRLNVVVSYVIGEENYHEVVGATELVKSLGADEIRFRVDFTDVERIQTLSDIIIQELDGARQYQDQRFKVTSVYSEKEIEEDDSVFYSSGRKCFNQHFWACVGPDCNLYACGHRTYQGVEPYGSLLDHSFRELWTSEKRLENLGELPDECCKFCSPSSTRRNDFMTFLSEFTNRTS